MNNNWEEYIVTSRMPGLLLGQKTGQSPSETEYTHSTILSCEIEQNESDRTNAKVQCPALLQLDPPKSGGEAQLNWNDNRRHVSTKSTGEALTSTIMEEDGLSSTIVEEGLDEAKVLLEGNFLIGLGRRELDGKVGVLVAQSDLVIF